MEQGTSQSTRLLRVFLCHSSGDKPSVRDLYQRLHSDGFDPWLDEEKLLPGQDWQQEISKAIHSADVVLVCLSRRSVNKAGYVQREIKYALDVADEQPEEAIFIIPLKLEECDVPARLGRWHWVNLFEVQGYERLMRALRERAKTVGTYIMPVRKSQSFATWSETPVDLAEFSPYLLKEIDRLTTETVTFFNNLINYPQNASTDMEFMRYINELISKIRFNKYLDIEITCLDEHNKYFIHPWFPKVVGATHTDIWEYPQGAGFTKWFWKKVQEMKYGYLTWTDSLASDAKFYKYLSMGEYKRKTVVSFYQIPLGNDAFWTVAIEGHEIGRLKISPFYDIS